MSTKNILITGADGQLGSGLRKAAVLFPQHRFVFANRDTLNIADEKAVNDFFFANYITACVNCAAYTAVDKAEQERQIAEDINASAVGYLAAAAKQNGAAFIHISTDYVFNGLGTSPYKPNDATDPVNFYGATKLHGEQKAIAENPDSIIIRTAWVYSSFGNNFVKTMMRLMKDKETIGVVADQKGSPTYAADLAAAIMQIICTENFVPGIYHYTNSGETTWFGFAQEIAKLINSSCIVNPITTGQYPTPAKRPAYSVLDTKTMTDTFDVVIPEWQDSLKKCIANLEGR